MSPSATRIAILITELMVFFIVTAFVTYFISHAGALQLAPTDKPSAFFPVIAYDGNRERPDAKNYLVENASVTVTFVEEKAVSVHNDVVVFQWVAEGNFTLCKVLGRVTSCQSLFKTG